jgi:protein-L-isoaspartate(D-aspartate) O-methyltransferase
MNFLEEEKKELIIGLRNKGIKDENVLTAIHNVPREKFVPESLRKFAYEDNALPITHGQTISQPFTVAYMTQDAMIKPGSKVLEIGTGSGYQCAILCEMGADVYTVERIENLYESSKKLLGSLGYKFNIKLDDGTLGWSEHAPFKSIIVTAAAPEVPHSLTGQLAVDGRLVIPVGSREYQRLYILTNTEHGVKTMIKDSFKFVPLIGDEGWDNSD